MGKGYSAASAARSNGNPAGTMRSLSNHRPTMKYVDVAQMFDRKENGYELPWKTLKPYNTHGPQYSGTRSSSEGYGRLRTGPKTDPYIMDIRNYLHPEDAYRIPSRSQSKYSVAA